MNLKTYIERAYKADAFSNEQLRNESSALHHLIGQLEYLSETTTMSGRELNGHELNKYGKHVIMRLKEIVNDYKEGKAKGQEVRDD